MQRRIVLFATHGLVAGEASGAIEPSLVLTLAEGCASNVESDDGLLAVSEIATLTLDADWVILSGCNTGAPEGRYELLRCPIWRGLSSMRERDACSCRIGASTAKRLPISPRPCLIPATGGLRPQLRCKGHARDARKR